MLLYATVIDLILNNIRENSNVIRLKDKHLEKTRWIKFPTDIKRSELKYLRSNNQILILTFINCSVYVLNQHDLLWKKDLLNQQVNSYLKYHFRNTPPVVVQY